MKMAFDVGDAECSVVPDWAAKLTGMADVPALIAAAKQADENAGTVWFYRICPASVRHTTTLKRKGCSLA